jgi:hypothetical protein
MHKSGSFEIRILPVHVTSPRSDATSGLFPRSTARRLRGLYMPETSSSLQCCRLPMHGASWAGGLLRTTPCRVDVYVLLGAWPVRLGKLARVSPAGFDMSAAFARISLDRAVGLADDGRQSCRYHLWPVTLFSSRVLHQFNAACMPVENLGVIGSLTNSYTLEWFKSLGQDRSAQTTESKMVATLTRKY